MNVNSQLSYLLLSQTVMFFSAVKPANKGTIYSHRAQNVVKSQSAYQLIVNWLWKNLQVGCDWTAISANVIGHCCFCFGWRRYRLTQLSGWTFVMLALHWWLLNSNPCFFRFFLVNSWRAFLGILFVRARLSTRRKLENGVKNALADAM